MKRALGYLRDLAGGEWQTLDTETTGLGPYDVVIEVAVLHRDGDTLFHSLVRPERPIQAKAMAVHGLDEAALAEAPSWSRVWPTLHPVLRKAPTLAWNAAFDLRLLRQTCDRHDQPFQTPSAGCLRVAFQRLHPHVRATLDAACLTLGVPIRPSHRARQDAEVARRVAWVMLERLNES